MNAYAVDSLLTLILGWVAGSLLGDIAHAQSAADIQLLIQNGFLPPGTDVGALTQALGTNANGQSSLASLFDFSPADFIVPLLVSAIYNIYFVAGSWQATPGKRWCKIIVVNADGSKLSLLQSALRHAASGLSTLVLGIGFLFALFTAEKTTLHDILCGTRVVMREES